MQTWSKHSKQMFVFNLTAWLLCIALQFSKQAAGHGMESQRRGQHFPCSPCPTQSSETLRPRQPCLCHEQTQADVMTSNPTFTAFGLWYNHEDSFKTRSGGGTIAKQALQVRFRGMLCTTVHPHRCQTHNKWKHSSMMVSFILPGTELHFYCPCHGTKPTVPLHASPKLSHLQLICAKAWGVFPLGHLAISRAVFPTDNASFVLAHREVTGIC